MHNPIRHKYIRANEAQFMKTEYKVAVMIRSKIRNKCNNETNMQSLLTCKMQRNIYNKLLRKIKKICTII